MRSKRRLTFWSVFGIVLAFASVAAAHRDYAGDVYPTVSERDGQFVVQFFNNRTEKHFETTVTPRGEIVKKRSPIGNKYQQETTRLYGVRGNEIGFEFEGERFVFPRWPPSTPESRHFRVEQKGRIVGTGELPQSVQKIEKIEFMLLTRDQYIFLARPEENELTFYSAPRQGMQALHSGRIGVPARIYDFPRVSNIARFEKSALVAWISADGVLQLSSWRTTSDDPPRTVFLGMVDYNTGLSIHVIGSNLLLAYHAPDPVMPGAMIQMVHCDLPIKDRGSCRFL